RLGFEALQAGGSAPGALNAANEIAVAAFLDGQLRYTDIPRVCEDTLARVRVTPLDDLEAVIACDAGARELAREAASRFHSRRAAQ
nr:1-deoxy-D-xylulose-5-phosphate reductoisomerase [Burkholderiales bacterium]